MHRQKMKRTERNTYLWQLLATLLLLVTPGMFSACSNDDTNTAPVAAPDSEIRFDVGVWNMMEGTRATFYDDAQLQSEGFMCAAYNAGATTPYISLVKVNYADSKWSFSDGKHYWPATESLDFFAYAPYTGASYIQALEYISTPNVTFNCVNLPMTNAGQADGTLEEFIYDIKPGLNKENSASGVTLNFQHPFTKIKLQLAANHPDITINSITFKSLKNNGRYDHSGSPSKWTPNGDATDLLLTFEGAAANFNDNPASPKQIGPTFLVIPQAWAGEIEVNADWKVWDVAENHTVSTTVPTTWAAGHSYTYTFTITETDLIVDTTKFTEQW